VFTSKRVGTGPLSYEKSSYRAAVSQMLRNTGIGYVRLQVLYEAYSESKYCFAVKINRVRIRRIRIKFYCYQIQHTSNYFSTYTSPFLRQLS